MQYIQLNQDDSFFREITTSGNIEWDNTHFCPANSLTEEEAVQFKVFPLTVTAPPTFDVDNQRCVRVGCELLDNIWKYKWEITDFSEQEITGLLEDKRTAYIKSIDTDVDKIIYDVIGNRATEYIKAEKEAQEFKDGGYTGLARHSVQTWADINQWTPAQAADDILNQSSLWHQAEDAMRTNRLTEKKATRLASNLGDIENSQSRWKGFVTYIRGQLGV